MSESTFRRSFLAQFADSENPTHVFTNAYLAAQKQWVEKWGWPLYRTPVGSDERLLDRVRIPASEGDEDFEEQVLVICKLLVDLLNEADIARGFDKIVNEAGISKLERLLVTHEYADTERDVALLRQVQRLRSKGAAHSKGSDWAKTLAKELHGMSRSEFITDLLARGSRMLVGLSALSPKTTT